MELEQLVEQKLHIWSLKGHSEQIPEKIDALKKLKNPAKNPEMVLWS